MAENTMLNVGPNFDMDLFVKRLTEAFGAKGFSVNPVKLGESYSVTFEKGVGGINTVLGMGVGIKANISRNGDALMITYTDAEWTSKIIGIAIGWVFGWSVIFLIPLVTAIIGAINQMNLPKNIGNEATMIAASF
ncbi:MAG: hypothetical protein IKT46_05045 [Clostridia bacterium]|nr:hypothetical protein [Clostridia bacterium]